MGQLHLWRRLRSFCRARSRWTAAVLTMAMTGVYGLCDFTAPGEINVAIFYASSVVVSGWSRSYRFLWLTAALCLALTWGGLILGPQPTAPVFWALIINRAFVALGLIMIAAIVHQRMHMIYRIEETRRQQARQNEVLQEIDLELRRSNAELEDRVEDEVKRRLEAEQSLHQAQKMEAIGQLTGGIAHDFNNMLTTVIGNLELLTSRLALGDSSRTFAEKALHGAEGGASLVKSLLSFARRERLEPEEIDIEALFSELLALAQPLLSERIELSWELAADLWECHADQAQLTSALLNLVINARDAMPTEGRITISAQNSASAGDAADLADGDYVCLAVRDTGTGMPPEVLAHVFEPLFTTKPSGKGSGLGLAMVYGFAKQSGGTVHIESVVGRGTTVRLYLPRIGPAPLTETLPSSRSGC